MRSWSMRTFSASGSVSGLLAALFRFWSKWCQVILMAVGETCWIVRFNLEKRRVRHKHRINISGNPHLDPSRKPPECDTEKREKHFQKTSEALISSSATVLWGKISMKLSSSWLSFLSTHHKKDAFYCQPDPQGAWKCAKSANTQSRPRSGYLSPRSSGEWSIVSNLTVHNFLLGEIAGKSPFIHFKKWPGRFSLHFWWRVLCCQVAHIRESWPNCLE